MKNFKGFLMIIFVIAIIVVGYFIFSRETNAPENIPDTVIESVVVEITENGFSPEEIIISVGETVSFVNKDTSVHRPASDSHPSHKEYPDNIDGCNGAPFDSCRNLKQDEVYSFVFNHLGEWSYHDHLKPLSKGVIIVK